MKNILLTAQLTLREALSRKIFIAFASITTLMLLVFLILFLTLDLEEFSNMVSFKTPDMDLSLGIAELLKMVVTGPFYALGIILSIFSASSFIPNMLEKGNIDLLLSKPISRNQLVWGKFLGGLVVVGVNIAYAIIGFWLLVGIKFGVWDMDFLLTIITITFTFACLYSIIIFLGIVSRSSILAMMLTYFIFFIITPILYHRDTFYNYIDNVIFKGIMEVLYYIFPKISELENLNAELSAGTATVEWQPILTSFLFMILTLYGGIFIFSKKDY